MIKSLCKGYHNLLCILLACMLAGCIPENIELPNLYSVTTVNVEDITAHGAKLTGKVEIGDTYPTATCGFIHGLSPTLSSAEGVLDSTTSNGEYSIPISGLEANTTYYYRAYAIDAGWYRYGEVRSFVTEKDVTVTTGGAMNMTTSEATLSGAITDAKQPLACGIIYGTSSTLDSTSVTKKSTTSSSEFSVNVTGLSANTVYYYRAYVIVNGEYKYGEVCSFKTEKEGGVIITGEATTITLNSATLAGRIDNAEHNLTCGIIYGTSSTLDSTSDTKKSTTSSGGFSVNVTGLSANTTYYYRAYVIVNGEYKYGEVRSFKTKGEVTITTGEATTITYNSATLVGRIDNAEHNLTCGIIYGKSSTLSSTSGTKKSITSSGDFYVSVTGLSANTTYYYRAYVVVDGEYKYGEVRSFKTNDVVITTGEATTITSNSATLAGRIDNAEHNLDCGIIYDTSSTLSSTSGTMKFTTSSGDFSVAVTGLSANTTYYYRAYVIVNGEYKYGEVCSFKTNDVVITTGGAPIITLYSATLAGRIDNAGRSRTCGIIYDTSSTLSSTSGTMKSTTSSGDFYVSVTGLSANTTYYYRAYVVVDGEYKYGEVRSFKTNDVVITTGEATAVTYNSATLAGRIDNDEHNLDCGIIYDTSSTLSSTSGTKKSTTSSSDFSVDVTALSPNTTYYYRAYAVVDGGYRYGDIHSFTTESVTPGDVIDLGLSVKWASWNVGADSPEEYGYYFAWGEAATKSSYTADNSVTYGLFNSALQSRGIIDSNGNLTVAYDAATVSWGSPWRMPTSDEIKELITKCTWSWITQNGVKGYKVTGPNGNSIFLPAAGYRSYTSLYGKGSYAYYWSATLYSGSDDAFGLHFSSSSYNWRYDERYYGRVVRPVYAPNSDVDLEGYPEDEVWDARRRR